MRERTAELLRSALFESTFVVLGVILALAANEWREARMHRTQAEAALASIVDQGGRQSVLNNRRNLTGIIETFWYREGQLIGTYDGVLAALGASPTTNGETGRD